MANVVHGAVLSTLRPYQHCRYSIFTYSQIQVWVLTWDWTREYWSRSQEFFEVLEGELTLLHLLEIIRVFENLEEF